MPQDSQVPDWYVSQGNYVGDGSVYATGLNKLIEGTFTVAWDQLGRCDISCIPLNLGFTELFSLPDEFDRFLDLKVNTSSGLFFCPTLFFAGMSTSTSNEAEVRFTTLRGMYIERECSGAKFWNAPLINLIAQFRPRQPPIEHPLRSTQAVPAAVAGDSDLFRRLREAEANRLCVFTFEEQSAFIEPMSSYETAKTRLASKVSQYEATCMMVGSVPSMSASSLDEVLEWFPSKAITALCLASGTSVGLGFIDLRDSSRNLHGRVHVSFDCSPFQDEPAVVSDLFHASSPTSGLAQLISAFLRVEGDALTSVTSLVRMIGLAKSQLSSPDHAFSTIVRSLEGVCNTLGLSRRNLLLEIPVTDRDTIKTLLVNTRDELNRLAQEMSTRGASAPECATVRRIASRTENAASTEDSFGLTIPRLLNHYGLNDEQAIANCYANKARYDGLSWPEVLNKYRGQVVHEGRINYRAGVLIFDVLAITKHLTDVATRICLKQVDYTGTYSPSSFVSIQDCTLDYFQGEQEAKLFGLNGDTPPLIVRNGF